MLAIGRALMTNPKLLILDEATEELAPAVRGEIWRCIEALKVQGQSILLIDKNMHALKRLADYHYILEKGRTVWSGDTVTLERDAAKIQRRNTTHGGSRRNPRTVCPRGACGSAARNLSMASRLRTAVRLSHACECFDPSCVLVPQ